MHSVRSFAFVAAAATAVGMAAAPPARAGSFFDFEDGTLQGWQPTQTGGVGSSGVELHLGSQWAFSQHTGGLATQVSHDFAFVAGDILAFDMQAVTVPGGFGVAGYAGVTITFLNAFNVSQGGFSLLNTTGGLTTNQFLIDNAPHHYAQTMASFASTAGLVSTASLAKISLNFITTGGSNSSGPSNATVWFDNVQVGAVPELGTQALLLAGLGMTLLAAGRQRPRGRTGQDVAG